MKFQVAAEKLVMIDGKIITLRAGKLETTDKAFIERLSKCKGVKQLPKKSAKKQAE